MRIDNSLRASDVVLTFLDFGQIQVGDPAVGSQIEFLSQSNVLRIPELILDGARFTGVSLTGSAIQLHPHVTVVVDEAAASQLAHADYYRYAFANKPAWQGL